MTTTPEYDTPEQQGPRHGAAGQGVPGQGPMPPPPPPPYYYGPYQQPPKKKHRVRKFLLISAAALVVLIGIIVGIVAAIGSSANNAVNPNHVATSAPAAPASSQASTPTGPAMLNQGEPASITQNGSNAAIVTVTSVNTSTTPADQYGSNPQNGYFVVANVSVATDPSFSQGFSINPLDFYALNGSTQYSESNGNAYDALGSATSELNAATLGAGQKTSGPIVFDVSSPHGYIVYAPNVNGQPLAEWKY